MKGLTLHEPWASAIVHGDKRIENRTWKPWVEVRGRRIAIHAGKTFDADAAILLALDRMFHFDADEHRPGFVLGTAVVAGVCRRVGGQIMYQGFERSIRDVRRVDTTWLIGDQYGWILDDVRPLDQPFEARGMPGLWDLASQSDNIELTQCCGALRQVWSGDEGTNHYECSECGEAV